MSSWGHGGGGFVGNSLMHEKLGRGFDNPVHDAHATFRAVMSALSEPGRLLVTPSPRDTPGALTPAMTAIALALVDFETPVWCDAGAEVEAYIGFHTGARAASSPNSAAFAFITRPAEAPPINAFAMGSLEFPDRSTTIVVDVADITTDAGWQLSGPGIATVRRLLVDPLDAAMRAGIRANRAAFPCGHDFLFCRGVTVVGLPRSTHIDQRFD